ncbi:MAG: cyclic nucleotide-binding domain-containing protein [SAR324 cluster bacterium]|nr:cyclic nucleotide-binding domain-containing protein [SAR324 cluster bacterium]
MEYFIHGANILYLFSYLVRDILWLRVLTVVAASCLIPFFYFRPEPLLAPIYWNLLFTSLNIYWIVRLLLERRPVHLTGNDLRLYQLVFRCLTPREMLQLLNLGLWEDAAAEQCFIRQGDELERLMVICAGKACVVKDGRTVEELGPGQFIGGVAFISERTAPADIVALEHTWYMSWPKPVLKKFLEKKPDLHAALQLTLGFDLTQRLQAAYARA